MSRNERQDDVLAFLTKDHGTYVVESVLESHPVAQELSLAKGTIIATFNDCRFVIYEDGSFQPVPKPRSDGKL